MAGLKIKDTGATDSPGTNRFTLLSGALSAVVVWLGSGIPMLAAWIHVHALDSLEGIRIEVDAGPPPADYSTAGDAATPLRGPPASHHARCSMAMSR